MVPLTRRAACLALLGATASGLAAEEPSTLLEPALFQNPLDEAGLRTLQSGIGARLATASLLRSTFTQAKRVRALSRPLVSKGNLVYARNQGVIWEFLEPFPVRYVITPGAMKRRGGDGGDKTIASGDQPAVKRFGTMFTALFSGQMEALAGDFEVSLAGDESAWTLGLTPRSVLLRQVLSRIALRGGTQVERVMIEEKNGDVTDIRFLTTTVGGELTAAERADLD